MKTITNLILAGATTLSLVAACGDDHAKVDATVPGGSDAHTGSDSGPEPKVFHQIEHLARPGINEALLITNGFLNGYNATAPSFAGVDSATLGQVVGEAKTVLKALYLGTCFIDGQTGLGSAAGFHPAGLQCAATDAVPGGGGAPSIFEADGETLTTVASTGAAAYADKVFGQFEPDVMRVDTSVTSNYFTLCGDANSTPLLCGGRFLRDDVIDVTYDYLLAGAAVSLNGQLGATPLEKQLKALVSDGVAFSKTAAINVDSANPPDVTNTNQGHPDVSNSFPYSAPPF